MLPYFKKLPFVLDEDISSWLLTLSKKLRADHTDTAIHLFRREHPDRYNAPVKWYIEDHIDEEDNILNEVKEITSSILECIQIPHRVYGQSHMPSILYQPIGSSLATHVDHPDPDFDVNSEIGHEIGRSVALSIPLNYGVEEDPTVFYESYNTEIEASRCYYERNGVYLINTYAYHGTNHIKNERYTFQISFDLDMFSPDTDLDKIVTAGFPIISLK